MLASCNPAALDIFRPDTQYPLGPPHGVWGLDEPQGQPAIARCGAGDAPAPERFHARTEAADLPIYVYHCEENGRTLEVRHPMAYDLSTWGEVCYTAQIPLGETDFLASVRKVLSVPGIAIPTGNAELRNQGFTKLVKRDDGVYENVTRSGNEARYMRRGQSDSLPHLAKKIGD